LEIPKSSVIFVARLIRLLAFLRDTEGSHNGIAAVLKTAERKLMRVRVPHLPHNRERKKAVSASTQKRLFFDFALYSVERQKPLTSSIAYEWLLLRKYS
jgi:hypothetical protein